MTKAIWNNTVVAESDHCIELEGNYYFPPNSVHKEFLIKSQYSTTCPWKGEASYYDVNVNGNINANAAWYYPEPSAAAIQIKNYVAFWKGIQVMR